MTITIYTDGACRGNGQLSPSPGGWGAFLTNTRGHQKGIYGFHPDTTNQRMELTAAIEALRALRKPSSTVTICTDSKYVQRGMTEWLTNWKTNEWKTASNKPVQNADLWKQLDVLAAQHNVSFEWVKGHSGNRGNERADALANLAIDQALSA